jgi:hypothetical protein
MPQVYGVKITWKKKGKKENEKTPSFLSSFFLSLPLASPDRFPYC